MRVEPDASRHDLLEAVEGRRREIVERVFVRVQSIGEANGIVDAEYLQGVRRAVETAVAHTIEASAAPEDRPRSVPAAVLAQARLAARSRTPLETVLRRYHAGHAVLGDYVAEEAERQGVDAALLRQVLRAQAAETDRVLAAISSTYREEADSARPLSSDRRRALHVRRLLDGELLDPSGLGYELDRWHVGMVAPAATGSDGFIAHPDAARLVVSGNDDLVWGWLGFRERPDPGLEAPCPAADPGERRRVGVGEPAFGRSGWRLTHEQARAALAVAIRGDAAVIRLCGRRPPLRGPARRPARHLSALALSRASGRWTRRRKGAAKDAARLSGRRPQRLVGSRGARREPQHRRQVGSNAVCSPD
jgi:hypothetical protein